MRKIKYIGNSAQDCVIVDTMETARWSGPGYVERLLAIWGEQGAPWAELKITFQFGNGKHDHEGFLRLKGGSLFFYWHAVKDKDSNTFFVETRLNPSHPWNRNPIPLSEKNPPKKVLIKDIIETLI